MSVRICVKVKDVQPDPHLSAQSNDELIGVDVEVITLKIYGLSLSLIYSPWPSGRGDPWPRLTITDYN